MVEKIAATVVVLAPIGQHGRALLRFLRARGAGSDAEDILRDMRVALAGATGGSSVAQPITHLYRLADAAMHERHFRDAVERPPAESPAG
jgi:RNA polymerase sigma-70 factor (ECF subfamily)